MKKNFFLIFTLFVMISSICISCKTTPEPPPETASKPQVQPVQEPPPPPPVSTSAVDASIARAAESRKKAADFECPAYFPSDWESIEAQYTAAGNMPKSSNAEVQQAAASFNAAADAYDGLFKKTIPLYAQAREDEIMSVRDELIATGLTGYYPEYLKNADDLALAALDQYEAEDYYGAKDTAAKALNEYETLLLGARTVLTRQEIIDRGFVRFDSDNFNLAEEVAQKALEEFNAGNREAAVDNAEEALLRYNIVLTNGWVSYASSRRSTASAERERALAEKANVAARETFRQAETLYNQAGDSIRTEKYNHAAINYIDAEAMYIISRQETEEKRLRAEEAIRLAEEKIENSSETAIEAERIIEGGSR